MPSIREVSVPSRRWPVMENGFFTLPIQTFLESTADSINNISGIVSDDITLTTEIIYTTTGPATIMCTNPITITLNPSPAVGEAVTIKRLNGDVVVLGNIFTRELVTEVTLSREGTSLDFYWSSTLNQWNIL